MNSKYKLVTITMTIGFFAALSLFVFPSTSMIAYSQSENQTEGKEQAQEKLFELVQKFNQIRNDSGVNLTLPQGGELSAKLQELRDNDAFDNATSKLKQKVQELGERRFGSTESESDNSGVAEIVLLSQKLKKSSSYHNLVGQVKNIGNDTAQYVRIDVTIYDKNGDVIGTDFGFATAKTLKPNQKSSFDLLSDDFKAMDHYEISLQWRNPDFSEGYTENAQIYKIEQNGSDEQNGSEAGSEILEKTNEAADEIREGAEKAADKIEDQID